VRERSGDVDTRVRVGSVELPHAVMTASGTSGHGAELGDYFALDEIGAVTVKSLSVMPWSGNPAPRLHPLPHGMINAVGLQGPGVAAWFDEHLEALARRRARVVISVWGRTVDEYRQAAEVVATRLGRSGTDHVVAVEINLSCPNLEGRRGIFAHDAEVSGAVMSACRDVPRPAWAKLSPNTDRVVEVAGAVHEAGAEAVTLVNTVVGLVVDDAGEPVLGNGGGGLSGPMIHPVALRAVADVRAAHPTLPIVGVGGVTSGATAGALMRAGAQAVQVGTATFVDPRAPHRIARDLVAWAREQGFSALADITGHRGRPTR
jgi:dihydroorotate dehydrogenase (NAD+) catalytic subunit